MVKRHWHVATKGVEEMCHNLHPEQFKKEWSHVLIASGNDTFTKQKIRSAIAKKFHELYGMEDVSKHLNELIIRGDIEDLGDDTHIITQQGCKVRGKIVSLSKSQPDPYRAQHDRRAAQMCRSALHSNIERNYTLRTHLFGGAFFMIPS